MEQDSPPIEFEAVDIDAALKAAAAHFGCPRGEIRHVVLQEPSSGLFGLGTRSARIRAWRHDALAQRLSSAMRVLGDMDGHFLCELDDRDLKLTVFPPSGAGVAVAAAKAIDAAWEFEPEDLDENAIRRIVAAADGEAHVVGRIRTAGERDGKCLINVSPDGMYAELTLLPPRKGGQDVKFERVVQAIEKAGIKLPVEEDIIRQMLRERRFNAPIRIAEGRAAIDGLPGGIEYLFQRDKHLVRFEEDEKGRVDYRDLDLIENVAAGDVLARRVPPVPGESGCDVYGREIAARPGEPAELPKGENILEVGDEVRAGIDGSVSLAAGRILVSPVFHVKGDVNYATGNIDFDGTVRIDGLIEDAFTVRTRGSLFVKKSIGKSAIDVGGNLVVVGGILGRSGARIRVAGDAAALFIEHARLEVGGQVNVGEMILHSEIFAGRDLVMTGMRASLVGGSVTAGGNVLVRTIGGEATSRTHVRAGAQPELVRRLAELAEESKVEEEKLAQVKAALDAAGRAAVTAGGVIEKRLGQLKASQNQLKSRIKALRDEVGEVERRMADGASHAVICVQETAQAGTRIEIGGASTNLKSPVEYATFRCDGGKISVGPYKVPREE